jgi:hypothetical protein
MSDGLVTRDGEPKRVEKLLLNTFQPCDPTCDLYWYTSETVCRARRRHVGRSDHGWAAQVFHGVHQPAPVAP